MEVLSAGDMQVDPAFLKVKEAIEALHEALQSDRCERSPSEVFSCLEDLYDHVADEVRYQVLTELIGLEYVGARDLLVRAMRDDSNALNRHEAAFGLGVIGKRSHIPALCTSMLTDPNPMVRHEAAVALGEIGDLSAIDQLIEATGDDSTEVAASAKYAMQRILLRKMDAAA